MIINAHNYLFTQDLPMASHNLEDNTWQTIRQVCKAGKAADYWSVGQSKAAGSYTCTLLDFDKDGSNTMTFSLGLVSSSASIAYGSFNPNRVYSPADYDWIDSTYYDNVWAPTLSNLPADLYAVISQTSITYNRVRRGGGSDLITTNMKLFPPRASDYYRYAGHLLVKNAWTRDAYTYTYETSSPSGTLITISFYKIGEDGSEDTGSFTDVWNYYGSTTRTGNPIANLELLFVI